MNYRVNWLEKKNNDWIVANLLDGETEIKEVSINRTNKKGQVFPKFDDIINGGSVDGELWTSQAGKNYLFEPKPEGKKGNGAYKEKVIGEAMHRKEESIGKFQDNKEWSIMTASSMNKAIELAIAEMNALTDKNPATLASRIINWREWIITNWTVNPNSKSPF